MNLKHIKTHVGITLIFRNMRSSIHGSAIQVLIDPQFLDLFLGTITIFFVVFL